MSSNSRFNNGGRLRHLHARYEVGQNPLGQGAFADVYPAKHRRTGRDVAVKIFHADATAAAEVEAVEREIQMMRLLRHHPHVIRFYEAVAAGTREEQACIVMELAESGELYNHVLSQHGLEEGEARRVFRQLVAGVGYCHRNMVVHHDLKLENVLLDAGKNVKLADFGFSNLFGPDQLPATDCGSLLYAAPEVFNDTGAAVRILGPEVDVWSCGVILFAMLSGYLPFDGHSNFQTIRRIISGKLKIPSSLSDEPRELISGMLQVDPERRMSIQEVRDHPWLQHSIPRYLALPLPDATAQILKIADEIIKEVVSKFGFHENYLVESLHTRVENEATLAYYLMLDKRFDAPTRYLSTLP